MKNVLRNIILAATLVGLSACSLKEEPTSFVNKHTFYQTKDQCYAALNACYAPFNNIYVADFMIATEACTDLWKSSSSAGDSSLDVSPSKPQVGAKVWEQGYKGVVYCNEAINSIENSSIADSLKGPLAAEGRVLRAMYYYILTCMFDGVPYFTYMADSYEAQDSIRVLKRTPADTIRTRLYKDLRDNAIPYFTEENGLKVRGGDAHNNRSGYAHGLMLMAKFAIWNNDWEAALVPLKQLDSLYGPLTEASYPLEQIQWRYKNTDESIFEIQHEYSRDGVRYYSNVAAIMMPKYDRDKDLFDGAKLTGYGNTLPGWNSLQGTNVHGRFRPAWGLVESESRQTYQLFDPLPLTYDIDATYFEASSGRYRYQTKLDVEALKVGEIRGKKIDRRVVYSLGLGNCETGDTFTQTKTWGVGWAGPKFWCPDIENTYDSNNYRVFRYADAVLMMAECYAELDNLPEATRYLNMTRVRAGLDPLADYTDKEAFMKELQDERARELGGEFMRKFDLVRWGIWYDRTKTYSTNDNLKARILPCHRYYPIPDTQCALSGGNLDNPEYETNGLN